MRNQGLGVTHKRAFKNVDFEPSLIAVKASPSDIENIEYEDYEAQAALVNQFDYGDGGVDETFPISIWIGSLGAYNAGHLIGLWVDLPTDEGSIQEVIDMMTFGGMGDYYIGDYSVLDGYMRDAVSEYSDPYDVNAMAEELSGLSEWERKPIELMLSEWGITDDLEEAKELAQKVYVYESKQDAFWEMVTEGLVDPSKLEFYIDEEYFAQEMGYDWYEGGELYEDYGGDWDMYLESMRELMFNEGGATPEQLASYVDKDWFMSEIETEATTHEDSSGYYIYYG